MNSVKLVKAIYLPTGQECLVDLDQYRYSRAIDIEELPPQVDIYTLAGTLPEKVLKSEVQIEH